jgi:hypothetical protein
MRASYASYAAPENETEGGELRDRFGMPVAAVGDKFIEPREASLSLGCEPSRATEFWWMGLDGEPESEGLVPDPARELVFLRTGRSHARRAAGLLTLNKNGGASSGTLETECASVN